jgi:tetratricopeptide (TPR) repeat protein
MHSLLVLFAFTLFGSPRGINEQGNRLYKDSKYEEALQKYKEAQVKDPKLMTVDYNIGCSQYKMESYQDAGQAFMRIISSLEEEKLKEKTFYNLGNVLFKSGDLENSMEMYKQALRMDPKDVDAKINLEFVQKTLEQAKKDQKDKDKKEKEDKNKDKKEDKDKKKDKDKDKDKKKQEQEQKMSQEAAKNLLEALKEDEKDAKKKSQPKGRRGMRGGKDW